MPGRETRVIERQPISGSTTRTWYQIERLERRADGTWVTHRETFVVPPLDDGTSPTDKADVLQCGRCRRLVQRSVHSFTCQGNLAAAGCGYTYCTMCRVLLETEHGTAELCTSCAEEAKRSPLAKTLRKLSERFWGTQ